MAFFKNILQSIKTALNGAETERREDGVAKQRSVISDYQHATTPSHNQPVTHNITPTTITTQQNASHKVELPEISDIESHVVTNAPAADLDTLCDMLGINRRKITCDRGTISIPFDASGCDFETKWQLSNATSKAYGLDAHAKPNNIACSEIAKRVFSSIKAAKEECFVCGNMLISINQDIDDEGFMLAEITNTHNGNTVFFDIPASCAPDGSINVDFNIITTNITLSRDKIA